MDVDSIGIIQAQQNANLNETLLINTEEIKAILYLGLRGDVSLPLDKHEVDIFA